MEKSRLNQARTLAIRRNDLSELAEIDEQLATLNAELAERNRDKEETKGNDVLAKVNERNRKANLESIRNAELREAERKRRERKLMAAGGSGTSTPVNFDPSARLRTVPKVFNSRSGTPQNKAGVETPRSISPLPPASGGATTNTTATTSSGLKKSFEASMFDSVEVDLGDF
ncbi:hypothetical protein NLI96_g12344 [Meripilus lineatus]|uniref:Uncharacterized protein n=1 Tax=Meripilus lineatus TaxID=2056292 RepID=A0AAD5UQ14_9APHY|nr:hypothetical protein NLI96_g12344 [Physisporinus lineatus]